MKNTWPRHLCENCGIKSTVGETNLNKQDKIKRWKNKLFTHLEAMRIDKPGVHGELRTSFSKLKKVGRQGVSNPGPLPPRATTSPLNHHRCPCCRLYLDGTSLRCRSNLGATEMHLRTFLSLLDQTKEKVWITLMIFLTLCQLSRETKRKKRFKLEKTLDTRITKQHRTLLSVHEGGVRSCWVV